MTGTETAKTKTAAVNTYCECRYLVAVVDGQVDENGAATWEEHDSTGCKATTKRDFAQGHDAKLKSRLIKWGSRGVEVLDRRTGEATSAQQVANRYGFAYQVATGIALAQAKQEKRAAAADRKHARRAAKAQAPKVDLTKPATPELSVYEREANGEYAMPAHQDETETPVGPIPFKAKVGRWTYEGTLDGNTFTYKNKLGQTKSTESFTVVV
jgi:hypothetical protein